MLRALRKTIGRWLRDWRIGSPAARGGSGDAPFVRRGWLYTALHFSEQDAQSRMVTWQPDRLLVDYTRTMMGALLFQPHPRRIGMVGLGGGSQAKFCYRHLPAARIEVVEISSEVVALRREFRIPEDGERFHVHIDDGARFLHERPGRYDLLLIDGYDATGIPAALATQSFYDDCRAALAPGGAMAVNLYLADAEPHIGRLRRSFGRQLLVVDEPRMSNRVVFGWTGDARSDRAMELSKLAFALSPRAYRQLLPVFRRVREALLQSA